MEYKKFDLEIIKEITRPIEGIQGEIQSIKDHYNNFIQKSKDIVESIQEEKLLENIRNLKSEIMEVNEDINELSMENLNKFLFLQDSLIKKYKESFKYTLKALKIDKERTKSLGLSFIEKKLICKIIDAPFYVPSLPLDQWIELLNSLKNNSIFRNTIQKVNPYYEKLVNDKLEKEIALIDSEVDPQIIQQYKAFYVENPISFRHYMKEMESKLSKEELRKKRKIIEKIKNQEEMDKLKKKQEEQFHSSTYQEYINLPDEEFERRRRKQKREKLSDIAEKPLKDIEISQEVMEKIEKFKEQFNESFEEKYLVKKDEEKDPIEIIRERKEKKLKEYKEYIKKLKDEM
ncbi:MAG: hypothetical protein ACFFAS_08145 [Promethearchaeota archaeon]